MKIPRAVTWSFVAAGDWRGYQSSYDCITGSGERELDFKEKEILHEGWKASALLWKNLFLHMLSIARADAPEQREKLYDKMNDVMREKYDIDLEDSIMDTIEEKALPVRSRILKTAAVMGSMSLKSRITTEKSSALLFCM